MLFNLGGILCPVRKAQPSGNTDAVGVGHDYARGMEDIALDQIGSFAANTGQLEQIFHSRGHLAAVVPEQHLSAAHQIPAFAVEEAAGVDVFGDLGRIGLGKGFQCGKALKQRGSYLVDPFVGALGGQTHGKQQFVVLVILQRAQCIRVKLFQRIDNGAYIFFSFHSIDLTDKIAFIIS